MKSISTIVLQVIILVLTLQLSQAQDVLYPKWTTPTAGTGGVYSSDGSMIVTYGGYGASIWKASTGELITNLVGHTN